MSQPALRPRLCAACHVDAALPDRDFCGPCGDAVAADHADAEREARRQAAWFRYLATLPEARSFVSPTLGPCAVPPKGTPS